MIKKCPVCNNNKFKKVFRNNKIPKYELTYYKDQKSSLKHKFVNINFVLCNHCGFLFNNIYRQLNYKESSYDANRSKSDFFVKYLKSVCNDLLNKINKITKKNKTKIKNIIEIGAGDSHFSKLISSKLNCNVFAFDPTWVKKTKSKNLIKINDYYSSKYKINPDLVIFRHVLEHVSNVKKFISNAVNENPEFVFIEIPISNFVLKNNFHYFENEHCSYFDKFSLELLMNKFNYKKIYAKETFNKEYLVSLWQYTNKIKDLNLKNKNININLANFVKWKKKLIDNLLPNSIIWGAGGKGVMIMNMLNLNYKKYNYIVDLNNKLHGKFIPGTGNEIISPHLINKLNFQNVYYLNILYKNEIKSFLKKLNFKGGVKPFFIK